MSEITSIAKLSPLWISLLTIGLAVGVVKPASAATLGRTVSGPTLQTAMPVYVVPLGHAKEWIAYDKKWVPVDGSIDPSPDGRWLCRWVEASEDGSSRMDHYTLWISSTSRPQWRRAQSGDGVGSWRPDSRAYTFVDREPGRYLDESRNRIVTVSLPTLRVHSIRSPFGHPELPTWSPDGKTLAVFDCPHWSSVMKTFEGMSTDPECDTFTVALCWITPSGRCLREMPEDDWGPHGSLAISPDGRRIAFTTTNYRIGGCGSLTIVDLSNGKSTEPFEPHPDYQWRNDCYEPIAIPNDDCVVAGAYYRGSLTFLTVQMQTPFKINTISTGIDETVVGSWILIDNSVGSDNHPAPLHHGRYGSLHYRISPSGVKNAYFIDVAGDSHHFATTAKWIWVCDDYNAVGYRIGQ